MQNIGAIICSVLVCAGFQGASAEVNDETFLQEKITQRLDESDIEKLIIRSVVTYDLHKYDELVALFTEDARYNSPTRGALVGHDQIRDAMEQRPKGRLTRHLLSNIEITVTNAYSAKAQATIVAYLNADSFSAKGPAPQTAAPAIADYYYEFRKDSGVWLISEKTTDSVFEGSQLDN